MELFRKGLPKDFFKGATDMHCHILPGVDDGFETSEAGIEALQYLEKLGFCRVVLTPHVMAEYAKNRKNFLIQRFKSFKEETSGKTSVDLHLAAEYMLDDNFLSHADEGWLLMGRTKLILTETSYMYMGNKMEEKLFSLIIDEYRPIIAHPERYNYADVNLYRQWRINGYHFQLNLLSLSGAYGRLALDKAKWMLEEDMYEYVGTDMHRLSGFEKKLSMIRLYRPMINKIRRLYENNDKLF